MHGSVGSDEPVVLDDELDGLVVDAAEDDVLELGVATPAELELDDVVTGGGVGTVTPDEGLDALVGEPAEAAAGTGPVDVAPVRLAKPAPAPDPSGTAAEAPLAPPASSEWSAWRSTSRKPFAGV